MMQGIQTEILLVMLLLILLIGLVAVVLIDPYIRREHRNIMLLIVLVVFGLLIKDVISHELDMLGTMPYRRTLLAIFGYILRPVLIVLYLYIVKPDGKYKAAWFLVGLNASVYLTATFSGICFSIDENNVFHRGPFGYTAHIIGGILLVYTVQLTIVRYGEKRNRENMLPVVIEVLIMIAVIIDSVVDYRNYPVTFLTVVVAGSNVFYYIWLHLQFVREHENALMAEQRIQILMAQIKPHFIYNSLTAIRSYLDEPDKAEDVLNHFAGFLRGSIDILEETGCIRVDREFETVESYLYLERERFGEKLTVEKDIQDTDFFLPAFTVQTLVENAIGHGIRKSESGRGRVLIRSFQTELEHIIEVADDGVGFLIEKEQEKGQNMDRSHIGLSNLKQRLSLMCDGTLEIESAPGKGTLTRVRIPMDSRKTGAQGRSDVLWKL